MKNKYILNSFRVVNIAFFTFTFLLASFFVPQSSFSQTSKIETPTLISCGVYDVAIKVQNFTNVGAISLVLNFDSLVFDYRTVGVTFNPAIASASANVSIAGEFRLGIYSQIGTSLPNDAVLFTLHFNLLPTAISGNTTNIIWNTAESEYAGPGGVPVYTAIFNNLLLWEIPATPTATIINNTGVNELNCSLQVISVTASGGGNYSWSDGSSIVGTSANLSITTPGTYTVTVTAPTGCTDDELIVITSSPCPSIITNIEIPTLISCGVYDVAVKVQDFTNIGAISLVLNFDPLVFDYRTVSFTLNPAISSALANVSIPGEFRLVNYSLLGTSLPNDAVLFTLHFNLLPTAIPGNTTNIIWNTILSKYERPYGIPTYNNNFTNLLSWSIPNILPTLTATPIQPASYGQTGSVTLNTTGGMLPYIYDTANPPQTGLAAGSFTYTVSDANGCTDSATVTINPAPICDSIVWVSNILDDNSEITLREAIFRVCNNGIIRFIGALDGQTISLLQGPIIINKNITIDNCNHNLDLTISGIGILFNIEPGASLTLLNCSKLIVKGLIIKHCDCTW